MVIQDPNQEAFDSIENHLKSNESHIMKSKKTIRPASNKRLISSPGLNKSQDHKSKSRANIASKPQSQRMSSNNSAIPKNKGQPAKNVFKGDVDSYSSQQSEQKLDAHFDTFSNNVISDMDHEYEKGGTPKATYSMSAIPLKNGTKNGNKNEYSMPPADTAYIPLNMNKISVNMVTSQP